MDTLDASPDSGSMEQLETLFQSADPGGSGLLSFSEFAYLILKSGGTQEQVDALIDQFSVSSRAQRMVCYAALLDQLRDAASPPSPPPPHQQSASALPAKEIAGGHSPLPVPPQLHSSSTTDKGWFPASTERSSFSSARPNTTRGARENPQLGATTSPLSRSYTRADSRADSVVSRASSVASYASVHARQQSSLQESQRARSASGSVPRTPLQLSARFVASALRAAQQQGTPGRSLRAGASRSRSGSNDHSNFFPQEDKATLRPNSDVSTQPQERRLAEHGYSAQHSIHESPPPLRLRSSGNAITRMMHAATDAQGRAGDASTMQAQILHGSNALSNNSTSTKPHLNHTTSAASPSVVVPSLPFASHRTQAISRGSRQQHDSVLSSTASFTTAASRMLLLSLRDVFQQHVLPAASGDDTVLVSELEEIFAAHGIMVHPLELEAVVDSLELALPDAAPRGSRAALPALNTSSATSAADTIVTITGGADAALGLVDFCVLVSRLRPSLIQRIRGPATWQGHGAHRDESSHSESGAAVAAMAAAQSANFYRDPSNTTPPSSKQSRATHLPLANKSAEIEGEDTEEEPSVADVTVSPMTPPTAGTTPHAHRGFSTSSPHPHLPRQEAYSDRSSLVDARRPLAPPPHAFYDGRGRSAYPRGDVGDSPPTARQLSADRHFAVSDAPQQASTRAPSSEFRQRLGYAQSTVSSLQHKRSQQKTSTSSNSAPRRTKQPVWHADRNSALTPNARSATYYGTSPTSSLSDTARSSRGSLSPLSHRVIAPRRVNVSVHRSPSHASPSSSPLLPLRVLDTVQSAATTMLSHSMRLDRRHTGCIPRHAWAEVLRQSCPALRNRDREKAEAWIAQLCRRHTSTQGDVYAEVVESILTQRRGAAASPGSSTDASPSSPEQSRFATHQRPAASPSAAAATPETGSPPQQEARHRAEGVGEVEDISRRRLREALLTVCGGDTEALQAYLAAFDKTRQGYLPAHVWRASLEELFQRTMACQIPAWVLDQCYRLSRRPFDRVAAQEQDDVVAVPSSAAEKAARARVRRIPLAERGALCDYRFVLQEVGLSAYTHS